MPTRIGVLSDFRPMAALMSQHPWFIDE